MRGGPWGRCAPRRYARRIGGEDSGAVPRTVVGDGAHTAARAQFVDSAPLDEGDQVGDEGDAEDDQEPDDGSDGPRQERGENDRGDDQHEAQRGGPEAPESEAGGIAQMLSRRSIEEGDQRQQPQQNGQQHQHSERAERGERIADGGTRRRARQHRSLPDPERSEGGERRPPDERGLQLAPERPPPGARDGAALIAGHLHDGARARDEGCTGCDHRSAGHQCEHVDQDQVGCSCPGPVDGSVRVQTHERS